MKILYMNQGGGGNWGAIRYSDYNVLCLAECSVIKQDFDEVDSPGHSGVPRMSIQVRESAGRVITEVRDLDGTAQGTRALLTFKVKTPSIRVVFFHLKSANAVQATHELQLAVAGLSSRNIAPTDPILWIGDFNRADEDSLSPLPDIESILEGGGQALWNLDRAMITGTWAQKVTAKVQSTSGDNGHIAIEVEIE
jgi:hypothetical protein